MKKASVVTTSGDAIAIFREIKSLSPHGRYEIKVFPTYIHLHGKTFDYKIAASSVMR
jgi:structure-specific recognition protein 1